MIVTDLALLAWFFFLATIVIGIDVLVLGTPALGFTILHALASMTALGPIAQYPRVTVQNLFRHRIFVRDLRWIIVTHR